MERDYNNDHRRVVDVVRNQGVFDSMERYAVAVEMLVNNECEFEHLSDEARDTKAPAMLAELTAAVGVVAAVEDEGED